MIDTRTAPYAALLLRVTLGVFFLVHAYAKFFIFTPAGTAAFFGSIGLPPALAYLVIAVETLGGIALILGIWTRPIAVVLAIDLLGAIIFVHASAGFFFTNPHGGWEYPAMWMIVLVVQALLGDGAWALAPIGVPAAQSVRA
jgi:putative oxidoreductase